MGGRDGSKVNRVQILAREKQQAAATKQLVHMHQMGANADQGVHFKLTMINMIVTSLKTRNREVVEEYYT